MEHPHERTAELLNRHDVLDPETLDPAALAILEWLGEHPLETMHRRAYRLWQASLEPQWTSGFRKAAEVRALDLLSSRVVGSAKEAREKILREIDRLAPHCAKWKTGTGEGKNAGTVVLRDPETDEYIREIDHGAVQGYLKQIADLTGANAPQKTISVTASFADIIEEAARLREMPTQADLDSLG